MIEPTCIMVSEGLRPLRVLSRRRSPLAQLVRIWARESLAKTSTLSRFQPIELRPEPGAGAEGSVPGLGMRRYWLAVQVFHRAEQGWVRSPLREAARLEVPVNRLSFVDEMLAPDGRGVRPTGVMLDVTYD
jgi:hypothetical protein